MKNLLIVYPHWPPSNLAGVHRARLIGNYLPEFGWKPIVITVNERYYEESLDPDIERTVRSTTTVIKVEAKEAKKGRLVGDITLRAYRSLKNKAIELIAAGDIDFLWVPIPSFYTAILARKIHEETAIPYGIDYIDPWVDSFVGQERTFSKAWLSNQVARIMEPYAVKKASLISGVSTPYYQGVLDRNFKHKEVVHRGMPYGFDPLDHKVKIEGLTYPWEEGIEAYVYAGAFLPKSHSFLKIFLAAIRQMKEDGKWKDNQRVYFLGTGNYPGKQIKEYVEDFQLQKEVIEINKRFPFLHILNFLSAAKGVVVLGSTEAHYTASKIFQSLLSEKAVFGVFHKESSAVQILKECNADSYLTIYDPEEKPAVLEEKMKQTVYSYFTGSNSWQPVLEKLDNYSARASAKVLVDGIEAGLKS